MVVANVTRTWWQVFCYKHHFNTVLSWFLFSVLEILLFSAHFIDVNAAKCGTVLDNLSMKIYIYIFFFKFRS